MSSWWTNQKARARSFYVLSSALPEVYHDSHTGRIHDLDPCTVHPNLPLWEVAQDSVLLLEVQIQPKDHVLHHAAYTAPTPQHELLLEQIQVTNLSVLTSRSRSWGVGRWSLYCVNMFTTRTDDLYDLYDLYDLHLPGRADIFQICVI